MGIGGGGGGWPLSLRAFFLLALPFPKAASGRCPSPEKSLHLQVQPSLWLPLLSFLPYPILLMLLSPLQLGKGIGLESGQRDGVWGKGKGWYERGKGA